MRGSGGIASCYGIDPANPESGNQATGPMTSSSGTCPALGTATKNALMLCIVTAKGAGTDTVVAPTGTTLVWKPTSSSPAQTAMAWYTGGMPGFHGAKAFGGFNGASQGQAYHVLLRPALMPWDMLMMGMG